MMPAMKNTLDANRKPLSIKDLQESWRKWLPRLPFSSLGLANVLWGTGWPERRCPLFWNGGGQSVETDEAVWEAAMYRGVILNLKRNEKRRASLTRHLAEVGATRRYDWVEGIDGQEVAPQYETKLDPGNLGLWLTHEWVAHTYAGKNVHVHILEDDALLPKDAVPLFDRTLHELDAQVPTWDFLFTDIVLAPETRLFQFFREKIELYSHERKHTLVDLSTIPFTGTTSLFINKSSVEKYGTFITGNWKSGSPIDMFVQALIHRKMLKGHVTVPYMTSISLASTDSSIRGRLDRARQVCDVYRRAFFQDSDLPSLITEMQGLTEGAKVSPLATLYLSAEAFSLSDQWVVF